MALHIGKIIKKKLEESGMSKSEFSRRIETTPQNIYGIFKRKSMDTDLLKRISNVLNYDFFMYYTTATISVPTETKGEQKIITAAELKEEIDSLKSELAALKRENQYLREIHELMKEKMKKTTGK